MERRHILIVEGEPLYAEMFHLWLLQAPGTGRVSRLSDWGDWWDVDGAVKVVLTRAESLPVEESLPMRFFSRHPVDSLVVIGDSRPLEIPGCVVNRLYGNVDRGDLLHALGVKVPEVAGPAHDGARLTEKEKEVVCMTVKGCGMKEIAEALECTVSTVQSYKQRAMGKMGAAHLADLSVAAAAKGLRACPCRENIQKRLFPAS